MRAARFHRDSRSTTRAGRSRRLPTSWGPRQTSQANDAFGGQLGRSATWPRPPPGLWPARSCSFAAWLPNDTTLQHATRLVTSSRLRKNSAVLPRAENCPKINAILSRVLNELCELAYHMPNAAETVEAPYTAVERLTFLPQPAREVTLHRPHAGKRAAFAAT